MYSYLKEYVVENEKIKNGKKMIFYPVIIDEINNAEKEMNRKIPK